jgi:2-polyprenyl-3-methyl-5-hydroxy-6-metoxy-1,4-benzoquinol methylase
MDISPTLSDAEIIDRDSFITRLFGDAQGAFNIFAIHIGDRLGFYQELSKGQSLTSTELAARTGTQERYVREWLEQQAAACVLEVADTVASPIERRFTLSPGRAEALADRDSLNFAAPLAQLIVGAISPLAQLLQAYQQGGGVLFSEYGVNLREGQESMNRPMLLRQLGEEWIPAMPDVHARLIASPPAYIADIGCGAGWSCIGIARSYPEAVVHGYELDEASVQLANQNIRSAGLQDRVQVFLRDAKGADLVKRYDLEIAFECLHDMSDPVGVLQTMRGLLNENGAVLVVDERTLDAFQACTETWEQILYGFSILHCLPAGMVDQPSAETGTVMRPQTLKRYAREAGFRRVEILPIEHFFFRFYRLYA